MPSRILSKRKREYLASQLDAWMSHGLLSQEACQRIMGFYETDAEGSARRRSRALLTLYSVAVFLLGLGVLLLIAYNWDAIDDEAKLAGILIGLIATHGFALAYRDKQRIQLSESLFFGGSILYGAGIFLVAQILHVDINYSEGFLWWGVGVLPLALCLDSLLQHGVVCGVLTIGCLQCFKRGVFIPWIPYVEGAPYSILCVTPIVILIGIAWGYFKQSEPTVWCSILLFVVWMWLPLATLDSPIRLWEWYFDALGCLLIALAILDSKHTSLARPCRVVGMLLFGTMLLYYSGYDQSEPRLPDSVALHWIEWLCLAAAVVCALIGGLIRYRKYPGRVRAFSGKIARQVRKYFVGWANRDAVEATVFLLTITVISCFRDAVGSKLISLTLANIAVLALAFRLMAAGLREDNSSPFWAGIVYFVLWSFLRYIDLFGDFGGMLGASLLFMLCGLVLVLAGLFWSKRRRFDHAPRIGGS
jgi:uncharacterized membrane protein